MTRTNRRSVLKSIGAGTALLVGGVGAAGARGRPDDAPGRGNGPRQGASAPDTITAIAAGNDDFDTLVAALKETGLASVLNSNDDQYTVFAPTDEAFGDLLDALGVSADELLARDDLATILQYHVTEGRRYAASITNPAPVEMLNGEKVTVDGTILNGGGLGGAEITATNIEASNGVIHVINGVLLP